MIQHNFQRDQIPVHNTQLISNKHKYRNKIKMIISMHGQN